MLFFLKITRGLYNAFSGAMTPSQIAYGMCIGLFFAFMPLNLPQVVMLVGLVLITRASIGLLLLTTALLKPIMLIGGDALPWAVGKVILEDLTFLRGPLGFLFNLPIVALVPFERYEVCGGFVIALLLSAILFFPLRKLVTYFRENVFARAEQYRLIRWWRGFWLTKALSFVFVGSGR